MPKRRVAIVVPDLSTTGGVGTVAMFLQRMVNSSTQYDAEFVSLATSARDEASIRLLAPTSWHRGVRITNRTIEEQPYRHVGAALTEFEFQRYRPRQILTDLLEEYDLIQVVAGTPVFALAVRMVKKPICLFVATTTQQDRASLRARTKGVRRFWSSAMMHLNTRIERLALAHVHHVFAESEYTRQLLHSFVPKSRLSIGVPGVDTELFYPRDKEAQPGTEYILSVGRFGDPRKNVRLLFAAYHLLRQAIPNPPRLILAGMTVPSAADWAVARSLGIEEAVEMRQGVSREELANLYRDATLFVLSSDEEGLGIVILEAMASGIPVISTRCGGPETAVVEGETGYLVPVGSAKDLAANMRALLDTPVLRQQLGHAGRRIALERFSLDTAANTYLQKYDELLAERCDPTSREMAASNLAG